MYLSLDTKNQTRLYDDDDGSSPTKGSAKKRAYESSGKKTASARCFRDGSCCPPLCDETSRRRVVFLGARARRAEDDIDDSK